MLTPSYDPSKAETYWSTRLHQTNELAAVLSFSLPEYLNRAYSEWEIDRVIKGLPTLKELRVLDLGCGVGRMTVPMAQQGAQVTSFDNSAEMLDACRRNVEAAGIADRVTWEKGSADALPFPAQHFDVVVCVGVLEHLPPAVRQATLQEIMRVVRRPGSVALVINNTDSRFLAQEARYQMADQQDNGYFVGLIGRGSVEDILIQAGCTVRSSGSNLFQSFVKHVGQRLGLLDDPVGIMADLTRVGMRLDIAFPNKGDLDEAFADQWVIIATTS